MEVELCAYELYPATFYQPAEYCSNEAEPGLEFCMDHLPAYDEPDWDTIRKDRLYGFDE